MTEEEQTIDLSKIISEAVEKGVKAGTSAAISAMQPAQQSQVLQETVDPNNIPIDAFKEYKPKLLDLLKSTKVGDNFSWMSRQDNENGMFESIGAASVGSAVPEIWAKDVFRCCPYPSSAFLDAPFIKWHDDIKGKAGDTVHVITVGKAVCGTAGCAEPASTAPAVSAVAITLEEYQCSMYVCRDDIEDMVEDTITELNNSLASCLDTCIDNAFIANIIGLGSTLDKGTAYITPDDIAEAIGTMRTGTCEPVVVIGHPAVESRLMRNAQFVNAATFGDRSVITSGHIVTYLGLDFIFLPLGSLATDAPGTYESLMLSRYAVHAAKKRDPTMETQYLLKEQKKYFYASVRFGKSVVCNDGVLWIRTGA